MTRCDPTLMLSAITRRHRESTECLSSAARPGSQASMPAPSSQSFEERRRTRNGQPGAIFASYGSQNGARHSATIYALTGERNFSYRIAVTRLRGDPEAWGHDPTIAGNMDGCSVGFLPLETMWAKMLTELTTTPAAREIGRLAQLLKA